MEKIILFGAGKFGKEAYRIIQMKGYGDRVLAFCDNNSSLETTCGLDTVSLDEAKKLNGTIVVTVDAQSRAYKDIIDQLKKEGVPFYHSLMDYYINSLKMDKATYYRDRIAAAHILTDYYNDAETKENLDIYWDECSSFPFFRLFNYLDLDNVIELACGRGRHVPFYIDKAKSVTLVDILKSNIDICKERYMDYDTIQYYCNSGSDLAELGDDLYSAIFTYDAMVHFEMIDVWYYLKETYRVLRKGGYGLFHHSNDSSDYRSWFGDCSNSSMRGFMDKNIFAYLASRCGLEVVEQVTIDWEGNKDVDCVTLVRKPEVISG